MHTTTQRIKAVALCALLALGVACGGSDGDDGEDTESSSPEGRFSLQLSDLPSGYTTLDGYPKTSSSAQDCLAANTPQAMAAASQIQTAGLQSCYSTVYSKEVGENTNRPGSQSYLFTDAAAASRALPLVKSAILASFRATGTARGQTPSDISPVPGLGEESVPGVSATVIPGKFLRFYFWRTGNVVVLIAGSDVLDDTTQSALTDIAKKIDTRGRR
jgi:hypothetical protein